MIRVVLATLFSSSLFTFSAMASEVNISGSTSVARVMDVLAEGYNIEHPDSFIAVQGVGSTAGIILVQKDVVDLGMSSRYLTEAELGETLAVTPIAFDGLAVVVNQNNAVKGISRDQLYDVYKGKITNWKELGGIDQTIAVVTREASSGSRSSFESLLGLTKVINGQLVSDIDNDSLVVNSNSMVKTIVNHNKQAIGFISTGSIDESVKAIRFEGVKATNSSIHNGTYELTRPFLVVYKPELANDETKAFLEYLNSVEAKNLIREYGYSPIAK
ncbi:phosphate ABC transporter substrate-binding protein [Vibrio sinensis]|uniref:Phosphate ABC transporter substrate-binding protein n=1 Tax=Vibrio sinensis TaxID=2302434 RepID=A0A3A6QJ47_9VIBR|nr:phosphate ABC transporter substrate-binding protein [Vibrio sinensis]RJX70930.1 phosphate ABC transporter substrate-binding protein [Vibrio sinensis]